MRTPGKRAAATVAFGLATALGACANGQVTDTASALCVEPPVDASPAPAATLEGATGRYELVMTATSGPRSGESVRADLTLLDHTPDMQVILAPDGTVRTNASAPLYGWTELDLTALGAYEMGGLESQDPAAPGVGVYETRPGAAAGAEPASPSIILRLGSVANRRERTPFDDAFTALRVTRIEEEGFVGTWRSGAADIRASGWFCAVESDRP